MKDLKETFIKLIEKMQLDDPFIRQFLIFADSYDGPKEEEFNLLMLGFIDFLESYQKLKTKSEGYDGLVEISSKFDSEIEELRNEYEATKAMPYSTMQPILSPPEGDTKEEQTE